MKQIIFGLLLLVIVFVVVLVLDRSVVEDRPEAKNLPETEAVPNSTERVVPADIISHIDEKSELIVVQNPQPLQTVTSPLSVSGEARGYWFFEASFPIIVTDWNGLIIGEGFATAEGDWMTEEFVPFTAKIEFAVSSNTPYQRGTIIFQKDNPSGLPEYDDALELPILFN